MGEHTNTCESLMNCYVSQIKYNMLIFIDAKHLSHALNQTVKFVENKILPTILGSTILSNPVIQKQGNVTLWKPYLIQKCHCILV